MCGKSNIMNQNDFLFYDFENLSSFQNESIQVGIVQDERYLRYGDILLRSEKYEDYCIMEQELVQFVISIVHELQEPQCIIRKYNSKWLTNNKLFVELKNWLTENHITDSIRTFNLNANDPYLSKWLSCAFRGYCAIQLLLPKHKVIISPSDHMDCFVDSISQEQAKGVVDRALKRFADICFM